MQATTANFKIGDERKKNKIGVIPTALTLKISGFSKELTLLTGRS